MSSHSCKRCGYETDKSTNLLSHLKKIKVCPPTLADCDRAELIETLRQNKRKRNSQCTICKKSFYHKAQLEKHACAGEVILPVEDTRVHNLEMTVLRLSKRIATLEKIIDNALSIKNVASTIHGHVP
jgi:hypothetical protein